MGLSRFNFISSTHSNASYCNSFNSSCVPYFNWTAGRWLPATWRGPLEWVSSKTYSSYHVAWAFSWDFFASMKLERYLSFPGNGLSELCVLHLARVPALQALICMCQDQSAAASQACLASLEQVRLLATTEPCVTRTSL